MIFKGCARCHGDVYREEELGGRDSVCLQCGHRVPAGVAAVSAEMDDAALIRWLHAQRSVRAA
jgi:hypothetical protein